VESASATLSAFSLSRLSVEEVRVGFDILKSLNLRIAALNSVSCPPARAMVSTSSTRCGRWKAAEKHRHPQCSLSHHGCVVKRSRRGARDRSWVTRRRLPAGPWHDLSERQAPPSQAGQRRPGAHVVELCEKKAAEIEAQRGGQSEQNPLAAHSSSLHDSSRQTRAAARIVFPPSKAKCSSGASGAGFLQASANMPNWFGD